MKAALTIFLIIGFIGIAVFGVFAINHGSGHSRNGCIAATAQGIDCPKEENTASFLNFHLDTFRNFSLATFGENLASAFLLLIALVLIAALGFIARIQPVPQILSHQINSRGAESQFIQKKQFLRWLALRHQREPHALQ